MQVKRGVIINQRLGVDQHYREVKGVKESVMIHYKYLQELNLIGSGIEGYNCSF